MDVSKEIEFFDREVAQREDSEVLDDGAYRRVTQLFHDLIEPRRGEVCVDLACGTGAFTRRLRGFGMVIIGVDVSSASIARARARARGEAYLVGDIRATPLPTASADIIVYSGVLHHCPTPSDRIAVLREGARLLRPGGRLFAYDPSAHSPAMLLYRDPRSPFHSTEGKTPNEVLIDRHALRDELAVAGFEVVRIRGTSGMTFGHLEGKVARYLRPIYNSVYERVMQLLPLEDRFGTFLVTFARRPLSV